MKKIITAVHDDDLVLFLKQVGVYDNVISRSVSCSICKATITIDNIYAILPKDEGIEFVCSDSFCQLQLSSIAKTDRED